MPQFYLRWVVVGFLFVATGLSFLDRQVLSVAILRIQQEFTLTDVQYGWVNTAFLLSYALMFTLGGRLIDRVGSRTGLAAAVGVWSVASLLHGTMTSFGQLLAYRFALGLGEGGCFPGAAKAVQAWFGPQERALANGIAIGGAAIGAVVAPPLTVYFSGLYGWRGGFVVPGLVGVAWVVGWLLLPRPRPNRIAPLTTEPTSFVPFSTLLRLRPTWVFILIRFLLDPVIYFMMFWIPKYLNQVRQVSFERLGGLFWIPFLALGIANVTGGWLSDRLIARRKPVGQARKAVMGGAAALTMLAPAVSIASSVEVAIGLMAAVMFAHGLWITNFITAISDLFGDKATSTVVGLSGTAGAVSGLLINPLVGWVVQTHSYTPLWWACGLLYPGSFLLFRRALTRFEPLGLGATKAEFSPSSPT